MYSYAANFSNPHLCVILQSIYSIYLIYDSMKGNRQDEIGIIRIY